MSEYMYVLAKMLELEFFHVGCLCFDHGDGSLRSGI